ncbi:MAG TPA: anhydro-N-acetylmuramic acid kinase [Chitinophagales bacterium]|nr:anhydro-N-acetylmuramic acid kinase [Chitinophagales bacterium]
MYQKTSYTAIGLMSGSSLDGLDICAVTFTIDSNAENSTRQTDNYKQPTILPSNIAYSIIAAKCIAFNDAFKDRIRLATQNNAFDFAQLHTEIGKYFGQLTADFIQEYKLNKIDFIASHGQTIFHQPLLGFTTQLGCGAQIAAQTGCKVICDFRTSDIAYGGQGAPLVPIVEKYLFPQYKAFLNIGGICNISLHSKDDRIYGYDICAGNTLLNHFAKKKGMQYDENGVLARSGKILPDLVDELNQIPFCLQDAPKSLGSEHVYAEWIARCERYNAGIEDILASCTEHIAMQTGKALQHFNNGNAVLITGGGALHTYLTERIQAHTALQAVVPGMQTLQYKEALLMAFCGLLRFIEIPNSLASVTGAKKNVTGGAIYLP